MKTILVSIDFSPISPAVIAQAAEFAKPGRARVILLYIVPPQIVAAEYGASVADPTYCSNTIGDNATRRLAHWADELASQGLQTEIIVEEGNPPQKIVAAAEKARASLIVLGSHGHTVLYDLVMGSTAHGVLKRATCPVVIVPDPGKNAVRQPAPEARPRPKAAISP